MEPPDSAKDLILLEIRPATPDDLQGVLHLRQAAELAEGDTTYTIAERLAAEWEALGPQLGAQVLVVEAAKEELVACADVTCLARELMAARLWAPPPHAALTSGLLIRLEGLACALGRADGAQSVTLFAQATLAQPAVKWALEDRYFRVSSIYEKMEFALTEEPLPPAAIAGVEIRPFSDAADSEGAQAVWQADGEAFRDQRGHAPRNFARWRQRLNQGGEPLDPTLWLVAWDGDAVAGGALCEVVAGVGWIHHLFVRRPWRRRGLGEALTRSALVALHQRGVGAARLNVDGQSLTNAHELYHRVGFSVIGGYTNFQKIIAPLE